MIQIFTFDREGQMYQFEMSNSGPEMASLQVIKAK